MRPFLALSVFSAALVSAALACSNKDQSTSSGTGTTSSSTGSGGKGGSGGSGQTTLTLPQFVHGAAYIDTAEMAQVPIVIDASGSVPETVEVTVDAAKTTAVLTGDHFVATIDASSLTPGTHNLVATANQGTNSIGSVQGSLTAAAGSLQFTKFASDGEAYSGHLVHDTAGDALVHTWVSIINGKHALSMARLDGAFSRLSPTDVILNDPADEPLNGYTAMSSNGIGVVYRTAKAGDSHWSVKLRVVDSAGDEKVPVMDLTGAGSAFTMQQAGADEGGFSAGVAHITPATDPNNPPPLEVRFSRWDIASQKLVGPITLDMDQPQAQGSTQGPQTLEPLAEMGMACNQTVCLVTYTRDVYNALVDLNIPKLFIAVVDLKSGQLQAPPTEVSGSDWDTQMFGHQIIANRDGSFALVYTANSTAAALNPETPCDNTLERDLIFGVQIDSAGSHPKPKAIFDFEGSREYPRIAQHPEGYALFWEDQRSECNANGHISMAANVAPDDLSSLLSAYQEMPGSIVLPPEDPSVDVAGTNDEVSWSDNRDGNGLTDEKLEIFFDTYWHG